MSYNDFVNNPVRKAIGNFLNIKIIQNNYVYLSLWSVVHLFAGALIMFLLILLGVKSYWKYVWLIGLLILYEIIEFFLYRNLTTLFIPETWLDVFWDMIIGVGGGAIVHLIFWIRKF